MKKKFLLVFLAIVCVTCCVLALVACNNDDNHTHNYQWVDNGDGTHKQHCSLAGCKAPDTNYGPHKFDKGDCCTLCGAPNPEINVHVHDYEWINNGDGTHIQHCTVEGCDAPYVNLGEHSFGDGEFCQQCGAHDEVVQHWHNYLWVDNGDGTHRLHCSVEGCDEPDIGDNEYHIFWEGNTCISCGSVHQHVYTERNDSDYAYLAEYETCQHPKLFYYSCICGAKGTETFEVGEIGEHKYDNQVVEQQYLAESANCMHVAFYYLSCDCGAAGIETFGDGDLGDHQFGEYVYDNNETCYSNGTESALCEFCGMDILRERPNTATGNHVFEYYEYNYDNTCCSDGTETAMCTTMGCRATDTRTKPNTASGNHYFGNYIYNNDATCIQKGTETGTCFTPECTETNTRPVEKSFIPHEYVDGRCKYCNERGTAGLEYGFNGRAYVSAANIAQDETHVYIASTWKGVPVTEICAYFNGNFQEITIPAPEGIYSIDYDVFKNCPNLHTIHFGGTLQQWCAVRNLQESGLMSRDVNLYIGDTLLEGDLQIPEDITRLTKDAFSHTGITSVTIPSTLTVFDSAFRKCPNLATVNFANGVTEVGSNAFSGCPNLKNVNMPESIKTIQQGAFENCGLEAVTIGSGVTDIGHFAFTECTQLVEITIPGSVTNIGTSFDRNIAFKLIYTGTLVEWCACDSIGLYSSCDNTYIQVLGDEPIGQITSLEVPEGVTNIKRNAFYKFEALQSLTLPASLETVVPYAFYFSNVTEVIFNGTLAQWLNIDGHDNITKMQGYSLSIDGSVLTSVTIAGVSEIPYRAFYGCNNITSVVISDGVTVIEAGAFSCCRNLASVTLSHDVETIGLNAFELTKITEVIFDGTLVQWLSIEGLDNMAPTTLGNIITHTLSIDGDIVTDLTITGTRKVPQGAFICCNSITSVTIAGDVQVVGEGAFQYCDNLAKVTIESENAMCNKMFAGCQNLTDIVIGDGITTLAPGVFYNCKAVSKVILPASLKEIGKLAFDIRVEGVVDVYFKGTWDQFTDVIIRDGTNSGADYMLRNANKYCYSATEPPADGRHYWHYVDGVITHWPVKES